MPRRLTNEEYVNRCKEKGLDLPIENYVNANTKIKHKCSKGHIYLQNPYEHLKGHSCPICSGNKKKTSEEYYNECKSKNYDLPIENYVNANTKIKHKCSKGHIYLQTPHRHLKKDGCPICYGTPKKTMEEYIQECKQKGYDLPIEEYVNNRTKIKHKCNKCGNIYEQTPSNHLNGQGCPICKDTKKTQEHYIQECKSKNYDLPIEGYIGAHMKIKHKCNRGHVYKQEPHSHLDGYGCPICNESHGERFIRNYLDKHNIKYIPQKKFYDLKDKDYLSYDFYLPEYNTLIEYQGKQHYEIIDYFGGDEQFKKQQLHDKMKKAYAKENGYKLLELHYSLDTQDKVNKYLERRIKD